MERAEAIIAACRDTMLTTLEKIGGQSLICSWTRQDGSVVKLALEIRTSDQTTIGDAIRDMDDEEMARKLVSAVLALCDDGAPSEDTVRDWLERPLYPTIDAATHTFPVEVKLANTRQRIRPGMFGRSRYHGLSFYLFR